MQWEIRAESTSDEAAVERLVDAGFGPGRFAKTAYRLREGVAPDTRLSFVAENPETHGLVGAVRFWPVIVGRRLALHQRNTDAAPAQFWVHRKRAQEQREPRRGSRLGL